MPEVDRTHMLRVLAREAMEWELADCPEPYAIKPNGNLLRLGERGVSGWNPFDPQDWNAAGGLLVAIQNKPLLWEKFMEAVRDASIRIVGKVDAGGVFKALTPALIAQAAYEALRK